MTCFGTTRLFARFTRTTVIALTTAAISTTALVGSAFAQGAPKAAPQAAPAAPPAVAAAPPAMAAAPAPAMPAQAAVGPEQPQAPVTPLSVRPSLPTQLSLAPSHEGLGLGYKVLAFAVVAGGLVLYARKKRGGRLLDAPKSRIDILARSGLGVRSEVVVLEVDGTRLLVGMTPNAIQTLAVLDASAAENREVAEEEDIAPRTNDIGERVRTLLGNDEGPGMRMPQIKSAGAARNRPRTAPRDLHANKPSMGMRDVAGQARGLLLSADDGE
jgi:flagellar biogenesis protein FliO